MLSSLSLWPQDWGQRERWHQVLFICCHLSLWLQDWGWLEPSSVYLLSSFSLTSGLRLTWTKFCLFAVIFLSDLRTETDLNQVLFICFHLSLWPQDWGWLEPNSVYLLSSFSLTSGLRLTWTKFCLFAANHLGFSVWPQDWDWLEPSSVYLLSSFSLTSGLRLTWTKFCLFASHLSLWPQDWWLHLNKVQFTCFQVSLSPEVREKDESKWLEPSSVYLLSSFSLRSGLRLTWTKFCLLASSHLSVLTSGLRLTWTKFKFIELAVIFLSDLRTEADLTASKQFICFQSFSLTSGLRLTWTKLFTCFKSSFSVLTSETETDLNQVLFICFQPFSLWPQDWGWLESK